MRRILIFGAIVLLAVSTAVAQDQTGESRFKDAVNHGEFAVVLMKAVSNPAQSGGVGAEAALDAAKRHGLVPTVWEAGDLLTHQELADVAGRLGIDYVPGQPQAHVSGAFLEAFFAKYPADLREFRSHLVTPGLDTNLVLQAGPPPPVSPSQFD
jgi:hypothetical protein